MEPTEQQQRLARIIEANKSYEGLMASPDFMKWRTDIVDDHIAFLRDQLLSTDRSRENWKEIALDRLVAYQESVLTYETIIGMNASLARRARTELQKLEGGVE